MVLATSAPDKCMYVGYVSLDVRDFLDFMVAVFLVTSVLQLAQEKSMMFSVWLLLCYKNWNDNFQVLYMLKKKLFTLFIFSQLY